MRSLIVIPTFNEAKNIVDLVSTIKKHMPDSTILIVDDSSVDGTADLVEKISDKNVNLIKRKKKNGRGSAVMEGFEWGIRKGEFDYFIEMDADFSHDPIVLPEILKKLKENNDLVLGSRYMKESEIINWGFKRTFFSKMANCFAEFLLRVPINDYTNGYRGYTKNLVSDFLESNINSNGYIVLSEIAYFNFLSNGKAEMLPMTFVNRKRGESNLTLKEIISAFYGIISLRLKKRTILKKIKQ